MKQFRKHLVVFIISITILFPKKTALACGPWPAPPEEFRLSLFQPNIGDSKSEFTAYYFSMNRFYKSSDIDDFATSIEVSQNYKEWQEELKSNFSLQDFYKANEEYSYGLIIDSANQLRLSNTFINALVSSKNKEYFSYFKLAKSSEKFNSITAVQDMWGLDTSVKAKPVALLEKMNHLIKTTSNDFIRQRTAYIYCRLLFYCKDKELLKKVYINYLSNANTTSWIRSSAKYYYISLLQEKVHHNGEYYRDLVDIIDNSKDKRMICIKTINEIKLHELLPYLQTDHQKATVMAAYAIRYPAYSLPDIIKIDHLDPANKFIPLLLSREINKIEDWLMTPVLTEYAISASKTAYDDEGLLSNWFKNQNIKKDSLYALKVKAYVIEVIRRKKDSYTLQMMLCHLDFLLKDYADAKTCCQEVLNKTSKNSPEYLQSKINSVLIDIQQKKKIDADSKERIYELMTSLDRGKLDYVIHATKEYDYYNDKTNLKDALLVYLGRTALKLGDIPDAALLLSGTNKPWGEYREGDIKSAYFILNENANSKDFDQLITILRKKNKTPFEKYFCSIKSQFQGNFSAFSYIGYESTPTIDFWDVNKVLDLKGTYFINKDSLEQALTSFSQIPTKFWNDSNNVYRNYLTGNPFDLSIYDPHENHPNPGYKNNPDKSAFIAKLLSYKKQLAKETNPENKARLYYIIGNSYYSMTYHGKFWLMSKLWWGVHLDAGDLKPKEMAFNRVYYASEKALYYYRQALNLTKDPKKKAFYCLYVSQCENDKTKFWTYFKHFNKSSDVEYGDYKNNNVFGGLKRLRESKGDEDFFKLLIKECPLYLDFKRRL